MSETTATLPAQAFKGLPARTVRAEVIAGPDKGKSAVKGGEPLSIGSASDNALALSDPTVSRYHVSIANADGELLVVDTSSTNGTLAGSVRIERAAVMPGAVLTLGKTQVKVDEGAPAEVEELEESSLAGLYGRSTAMRRIMARVARVAPTEASVLIGGESGTGKEVVARALHALSARAKGPFVAVDCGALHETLVASELFGHEKGAFTGATGQHVGAFEQARGGTLFLDEIGELPPALQPVLLGVLERRVFRRLGGRADLPADVRLVSASHRDLKREVNSGAFRLDLFFRLAVVRVDVPPLREHLDDLGLLIEHFLQAVPGAPPLDVLFPAPKLGELKRHAWPGNVRELRNFVEATLALGETPEVDALAPGGGAPGADLLSAAFEAIKDLPYKQARGAVVGEFEKRYGARVLERAKGNLTEAARLAQMDRSHLFELLKRHGLRQGTS